MRTMGLLFITAAMCVRMYGSPLPGDAVSIADCIRIAKEHNKQQHVSRQNIHVSEARVQQAKSARMPSLDLSIVGAYQDQPMNFMMPSLQFKIPAISIPGMPGPLPLPAVEVPVQNVKLADNKSLMSELQLQLPLYTGGKISSIVSQAEAGAAIARSSAAQTESEMVYEVKKAYYYVLLAQTLKGITEEACGRLEAMQLITKSVYESGSGHATKLDYLKSQMTLETFRASLEKISADHRSAMAALRFRMGLEIDTPLNLTDTLGWTPAAAMDEQRIRTDLRAHNEQLKQIGSAIDYRSAKVDEAKSGYYPSFALVGSVRRWDNSYDYGVATKDNKNSYNVALAMSVNLFQGSRTSASVEEAETELDAMKTQYAYAEEGMTMRLRQLTATLDRARAKVAAAKEAMVSAADNRDLAMRAFQNDLGPVKDFIEGQIMESLLQGQYYLALFEACDTGAQLKCLLNEQE